MAVTDAYTDLQGLQRLRNNPDKDEALRQVAQQFESMFLSLMLKNMRQANAVFEEDSVFNSNESQLLRDMYDNQLSLDLANSNSTGLADVLYRQLSAQYGTASSKTDSDIDGAKITDWRNLRSQVNKPEQSAQVTEAANAATKSTAEKGTATQRAALADNPQDFVEQMLPHARAAADKLGTNAALLLAQAALETGWGKQVLADGRGTSSNNLFNIKANRAWAGGTLPVLAVEYKDGVAVREQSHFKTYPSVAESFEDFVALVKNNPRYADALDKGPDDVQGFIQSLHQSGYATDPEYVNKVLSVYEDITQQRNNENASITVSALDQSSGRDG